MAEQMIRFYGFEPEKDIKVEYVGLRKGERLGEKLWAVDEEPKDTEYNRILKVERRNPHKIEINTIIEKLRPICCFDPTNSEVFRDSNALRELLKPLQEL
jgi:FlaA1/EpsC-like NDP-sugar epimerase